MTSEFCQFTGPTHAWFGVATVRGGLRSSGLTFAVVITIFVDHFCAHRLQRDSLISRWFHGFVKSCFYCYHNDTYYSCNLEGPQESFGYEYLLLAIAANWNPKVTFKSIIFLALLWCLSALGHHTKQARNASWNMVGSEVTLQIDRLNEGNRSISRLLLKEPLWQNLSSNGAFEGCSLPFVILS